MGPLTLAFALALSSQAVADPQPLAWSWQVGEPVHFHGEHVSTAVRGIWFLGTENLEARAAQVNLVADLTCTATEELRRGWQVACTMEDVSLSGTAIAGEADKLKQIFAEYEALYEDASIGFVFTSNGRIRSLKLDAVEKTTARVSEVEIYMTQTIGRILAMMELELPKKGDDKGRPWKQGGTPMLLSLRSSEGTAGGIAMKHRVTAWDGSVAVLETEGRATVAHGGSIEADGRVLYAISLGGQARFDTAAGMLEYREFISQVNLTASSSSALPSEHSRELGTIERITPGAEPAEDAPEPGPSQEAGDEEPRVDELQDSTGLPVEAGGEPPRGTQ